MMPTRVVSERALPFDPLVPHEATIAAMREARAGRLKSFDSVETSGVKPAGESHAGDFVAGQQSD